MTDDTPLTTEHLDRLQFGKVLHKRPNKKAGFKSEAEGYAASLRQQAEWLCDSSDTSMSDIDELRAAAAFIERQQAELDALQGQTHARNAY